MLCVLKEKNLKKIMFFNLRAGIHHCEALMDKHDLVGQSWLSWVLNTVGHIFSYLYIYFDEDG